MYNINKMKKCKLLSATQVQKWLDLIDYLHRQAKTGCFVACSGGIDSILLAIITHKILNKRCIIIHAISPAVPESDTNRVLESSTLYQWNLIQTRTGEFENEDYLRNPANRCYYCKTHLYKSISAIRSRMQDFKYAAIFSGTNLDDLAEYRPGMQAANEYYVVHPYLEIGISKNDIRSFVRCMGLSFSDLPASPCLASRIYTGTRVTAERLKAIYYAESELKKMTQFDVVRCRVRDNQMIIELKNDERARLQTEVIKNLKDLVTRKYPFICNVILDDREYKPGHAFIR